jgi:hypothetical protein
MLQETSIVRCMADIQSDLPSVSFFEQGMKDVLYELRVWITIEQQFEGAGRHGEGLQGVHFCHPSCDCLCFALRPHAVFASMVTRA